MRRYAVPTIIVGVFALLVASALGDGLLSPDPKALPEPKTAWATPLQVAARTVGLLATSAGTSAPASRAASSTAHTASASATAGSASANASRAAPPASGITTTTFAVIGDYGTGNSDEAAVARLVGSWRPQFVVTTGDNYYPDAGGTDTTRYSNSVGRFYGRWLPDAFYPALGNHDYDAAPALDSYLGYFSPPRTQQGDSQGNRRYYEFARGPVRVFVLDSNPQEPDGTTAESRQGRWLRERLSESRETFDIVVVHHPPYSSGAKHGSAHGMRWPFAQWGADAVISGHDHIYERVIQNGIVYFVNGLGGAERYDLATPVEGSALRYSGNFGAQKVSVSTQAMVFEFYAVDGTLIDRVEVAPRWHAR